MTQARDLADGKFDTDTLVVDAANNRVGVGTTSPSQTLHVQRASSGGSAVAGAALIVEGTDATGSDIQILGDASDYQQFLFGDADDNDVGSIAYSHSSNTMRFQTNGSERLRILSGGGLTFNGDTATANALDDYEFGDYDITLTPSSSGSITVDTSENKATYVKIGNFVQAQGRVLVSSVSSPAGDLAINLPFTTTSSQGEQSGSGAPALFVWNSTQTNNGLWCGFFDKSISAFYIRWGNSSTPGHSASYIQASTEIRFSVSYITDS